jgi:predicted nucleic acid-binding protein
VARQHPLVAEVASRGGGFVCDTAPLVFYVEQSGPRRLREAVGALFARVEAGDIGCLVSTLSAAELLVRPHRIGPPAVSVVDGFLRAGSVGIVPPSLGVAHGAARLVARRVLPRLGDAFVAATAAELDVPLVTADRRLARAVDGLLVQDYA